MEHDLRYPTATGILEAAAEFAAIDIESIIRNTVMDAWAKEELADAARHLREAVKRSQDLTERAR
ncbi:hypothetical protein [Hyphomicrobium sp. DY-1]|uniref:hypothetical protein n=1 Tax=Hyphomicrobium sp. DY-1 TaxID=3075650 RepID=UPI0039C43E4E